MNRREFLFLTGLTVLCPSLSEPSCLGNYSDGVCRQCNSKYQCYWYQLEKNGFRDKKFIANTINHEFGYAQTPVEILSFCVNQVRDNHPLLLGK